ncbi:hypothetical protein [Vibrio aestuarianus]|uniref:Uncharacterized protein n=1 Tax=Vibrio aestuarianus TaxID=28171 RepID=A0ABD7YQH3_9VIBR|nr:hypothetical protein [Vibrio aestuarianus]WGK87225.1 hypothetical protein PYE67_13965 [Vibrio aestuarianus]HDZ9326764.1 hypothetical protein [Vibrio cholerae]
MSSELQRRSQHIRLALAELNGQFQEFILPPSDVQYLLEATTKLTIAKLEKTNHLNIEQASLDIFKALSRSLSELRTDLIFGSEIPFDIKAHCKSVDFNGETQTISIYQPTNQLLEKFFYK